MSQYLIPTAKGIAVISVLPEILKSPSLTAQWEHKLHLVEQGKMSETEFMNEIEIFIKTVVAENNAPKPEFYELLGEPHSNRKSLGVCPRCAATVREHPKGYFCDTASCNFKMWKESKFWIAKKKPLTADIVVALLKDGCAYVKGLYSPKTNKTYDATIILNDTGDGYVNFGMEFDKK